jgi:glycosyltransferase involved in cell wall biosynthesis
MAADYDSARAMGREGRARVERDFTIAASVEKTEAVYRSAIERNGGRGS